MSRATRVATIVALVLMVVPVAVAQEGQQAPPQQQRQVNLGAELDALSRTLSRAGVVLDDLAPLALELQQRYIQLLQLSDATARLRDQLRAIVDASDGVELPAELRAAIDDAAILVTEGPAEAEAREQ